MRTNNHAPSRPPPLTRAVERLAGSVLRLPPPTNAYTVAREVRIPLRDGVELAADLYRPVTEPAGTVLVRGPYGRSFPLAFAMARIYAARGYTVLLVSSRGTFGSGGRFDPMRTEVDDGRDVTAWMVAQPWFTGRFATLGASYLGFTQWALMADPPPEMAAAVVAVGPHDFAEHVWGSGAFRLDFLGWSDQVAHQEDPPLRALARRIAGRGRMAAAYDRLPLAAVAGAELAGKAPWYTDWVTRPDLDDPFWAPMRLRSALEGSRVPVLLIGGWLDLFLDQTVEQYRRLSDRGVDVALTVGAWTHLGATTRGLGRSAGETLEWLDEHLAGRPGRRRPAPVRVQVTGGGWRDLDAWPPPTRPLELFLHPGGLLDEDRPPGDGGPSRFTFDPSDPTPTVGGPLLFGGGDVDDSRLAARPDVVTFTTAPLDRALEVTGTAVLELAHSAEPPYADLFARVSEIDRRGRPHHVTEGFARLDPARGVGPITLRLRPAAHRFAAGSRIRLLVAGGSHPQFARNLGTGEHPGTGTGLQAVRHTVVHGRGGVSRLVLPVGS